MPEFMGKGESGHCTLLLKLTIRTLAEAYEDNTSIGVVVGLPKSVRRFAVDAVDQGVGV